MTKRLETGAGGGEDQCPLSLATGRPARLRVVFLLGSCVSYPQTEGGDGFDRCLVMSLVITKEAARSQPVLT